MQFALGVLTPSLLRQPSKKQYKKKTVHTWQIFGFLKLPLTNYKLLDRKVMESFCSNTQQGLAPLKLHTYIQTYIYTYTIAQSLARLLIQAFRNCLNLNFLEYSSSKAWLANLSQLSKTPGNCVVFKYGVACLQTAHCHLVG